MQFILLAVLSLAACAAAAVRAESSADYHETVAIPMAAKIREAEEAILSSQRNARIVGGNVARPNAHPYLAGLIMNYEKSSAIGVCAAVLVSRSRLLTGAHCWASSRMQVSRFVVVLGSHFLFSGGERIPTSTVVVYPNWNPATSHNNLAIIFLPNPVRLTNNIQPIALASNPNETFVGEWAVAAGYGRTSTNQSSIPVLTVVSEVELQVITVEACRRIFPTMALDNTVCTNGTGGVGTCYGDGGGPLYITRNGQKVLIGIGTWILANGCEKGRPSGFSRITSFYDFIVQYL